MPYGVLWTYPVDFKEFRKWLLSKRDSDFVGYACKPYDCPIRNYLSVDDSGVQAVFEDHILAQCGDSGMLRFGVERDTKEFVKFVDYSCSLLPTYLTADEVLIMLDHFYPELMEK